MLIHLLFSKNGNKSNFLEFQQDFEVHYFDYLYEAWTSFELSAKHNLKSDTK